MKDRKRKFLAVGLAAFMVFGGAVKALAQDARPSQSVIPGSNADVSEEALYAQAEARLLYWATVFEDETNCQSPTEHRELLKEELRLRVDALIVNARNHGTAINMRAIIDHAVSDTWGSFNAIHYREGFGPQLPDQDPRTHESAGEF